MKTLVGLLCLTLIACTNENPNTTRVTPISGQVEVNQQEKTQLPPSYDPQQFVEGFQFEYEIKTKNQGVKSCERFTVTQSEDSFVTLMGQYSATCDGVFTKVKSRLIIFNAISGNVESDAIRVGDTLTEGELTRQNITDFFYSSFGNQVAVRFSKIKVADQAMEGFSVNRQTLVYLNAPNSPLHGLLAFLKGRESTTTLRCFKVPGAEPRPTDCK